MIKYGLSVDDKCAVSCYHESRIGNKFCPECGNEVRNITEASFRKGALKNARLNVSIAYLSPVYAQIDNWAYSHGAVLALTKEWPGMLFNLVTLTENVFDCTSAYFKDGKFKYNEIVVTFPDEHEGEWQPGGEVTRL